MAVSTACGVIIAITGTFSFILSGWHQIPTPPPWSSGYIYWPAAFMITLTSPWFTSIGASWSHRLPVSVLRGIFAGFLFIVGINMLF